MVRDFNDGGKKFRQFRDKEVKYWNQFINTNILRSFLLRFQNFSKNSFGGS